MKKDLVTAPSHRVLRKIISETTFTTYCTIVKYKVIHVQIRKQAFTSNSILISTKINQQKDTSKMTEYIILGRVNAQPTTSRVWAYNVHDAVTRFKKMYLNQQIAVISCKKA